MQDKQYLETLQRTTTFKAPTPAYTIHEFVMHNDGKGCRSVFCLEEQRLTRHTDGPTVATTRRRAYPKNRTSTRTVYSFGFGVFREGDRGGKRDLSHT